MPGGVREAETLPGAEVEDGRETGPACGPDNPGCDTMEAAPHFSQELGTSGPLPICASFPHPSQYRLKRPPCWVGLRVGRAGAAARGPGLPIGMRSGVCPPPPPMYQPASGLPRARGPGRCSDTLSGRLVRLYPGYGGRRYIPASPGSYYPEQLFLLRCKRYEAPCYMV